VDCKPKSNKKPTRFKKGGADRLNNSPTIKMENNIVELSSYAYKVKNLSYQEFVKFEEQSLANPNDYISIINYHNRCIDMIVLKNGKLVIEKQPIHNFDNEVLPLFISAGIAGTFGPKDATCSVKTIMSPNPYESYHSNK